MEAKENLEKKQKLLEQSVKNRMGSSLKSILTKKASQKSSQLVNKRESEIYKKIEKSGSQKSMNKSGSQRTINKNGS